MKISVTCEKYIRLVLLVVLFVFGMGSITHALPVNERTQQVQDAIIAAVDGVNAAADVTDTHLAAITTLNLRAKGIPELKTGDFEGLSALTDLNLYGNQLSALPDGIFEGLTALTTLRLGGNTVNPMPITVSLKKVDNGQFKAVARTGAPFAIVLPISAVNGSIAGDATTVTIARGSVESEALTITRTDGTTTAVTVDIGTLPGLPSNHYGYTVSKSDTEVLEVIGGVVSDEPDPEPEPEPPANSAPAFSDRATTIRTIAENTDAGVNIGSVVAATDTDSDDTLTYTLSGVAADSFDIDTTTGQLKTKAALDYETRRVYAVTITVSDGSLTDTITVLINIIDRADTVLTSTSVPVSDRTAAVRDAIVAAVPNISDAGDVTDTHLAAITELNLRATGITTLEMGDFSGLTGLTNLNLYGNMLNRLPMGIFDGLTALTTLRLGGNVVAPMPLIVSLQQVDANQYQAIIPTGAPFDIVVPIDATTVTIPQGSMKSATFTTTGIPEISVLPMLPANHFGYVLSKSAVCNRTSQVAEAIAAAVPGVTDCRNVTEIDLASITELDLSNKSITSLKKGDFSAMLSLTMLNLSYNQLSALSSGIFEGMLSLKTLNLSGNTVDPLPLTVSLEKVGEDQFKAVLPTGAPFAITLPIIIKTGNVASGAITVLIPQGSVESVLQTITRPSDTTDAVTVDIGTLPSLPAMHSGYALAKVDNLPLEILENINVAPVFTDGSTTTRSIPENTDAGVNIGSAVAATDANNNTLTYTLSGDPDAAAFDIVSTSGQLKTKVALDFETKTSYSVTVTVSDGILTDTITVTINVTDKSELPPTDDAESVTETNNAPVFTESDSATRSVAENTGSGVDIGSPISATDDDDDTLEYSLGGINAGSFAIDTTTGQLRTNAALDFETKSSYTVEITVSDSTDTATITVTINVTDVDEDPVNVAPVFTEGSNATRSVAENTGSGVDIGSAISATDANGDTLTYTLGGKDATAFSIDSSTGQLRTSAALDHETDDMYSVTISVSDGNGSSATITVTINITNVDEAPDNNVPGFSEGESASRSVAENTGSGVDIGSAVSATDADSDTLTYSISGSDASSFSIDSSSGQLRTSAALDHETKDTYTVTIAVSDGNGGSATITVTISVTDVDEIPTNTAPVFAEGSSATRSVDENTASDENIGGAVSATDTDDDTLTYTISGTDATAFGIGSTTGQLSTSATLDYETKSSYSVTITVSDENGGTATINVTIDVTNVNEAPVFADGTSTTRTIAENAGANINIGNTVAATDDDGDTLTYTLGGDPDAASFDIETTTGQLKTKAPLDFETESSYTVSVSVSDGKGGTDSITVTVTVTDLDETPSNNPPVFAAGDDPVTRSVAENTASGTNIGAAVSATDADSNTLAYLLSGDDASSFSIDADTGQLKTGVALNYETKASYTVTITVSDGSLTDTINVTISVTNANDPPVFNKGLSTTLSIAENTEATNIGDAFTATDEDGNTLTYSLHTLNDVTPFRIDTSNGQLRTLRPLDYEETSSYTVTIAVDDGKGGFDEIEVTINVTDVVENVAPVFTEGDNAAREVAENTGSGVNIGTPVAATDVDDGDTLTYSLGGDDAPSFSINTSNGQLRTHAALDYETKDTYSVTITVSDDNGGSAEIAVTISVTDVDENRAPVFTDGDSTTREVAENTASGVNISTPVGATDADDDTLTYSLGGDDASSFSINTSNGQLRTHAALDYEKQDTYRVIITADDNRGGSASVTVIVSVLDVDENKPPEFILLNDVVFREIAENSGSGVDIGTAVEATDPDDDVLAYNLDATSAAVFGIDSTSGQLRTKAPLDYETKSAYIVTITADDENGGTATVNVSVQITNVNEAPVFTTDAVSFSVSEDAALNTLIGRALTATDPDVTDTSTDTNPETSNIDTLSYSLSGTGAAAFSIDNATGQLKTKTLLDYETVQSYKVAVTVSDSAGGLNATLNITINVLDVDENRAPVFTEGESTTRSIAENTAAGTNIGAPITATDDDDDTLIYELLGTDVSSFTINSTNGQLKTKKNLDYETKDTYSVTILVTDRKLTDTIRVTINVLDVDENRAPVFTDGDSTTRSIAENTAADTNIGTAVVATDADNDTLTYTLSGTDAASFTIVGTSGQLKTSAALDFETKKSYTVTVTVSDSSLTDIINVTINVTDLDENRAPEFTEGDSTTRSVAENTAADTNIGTAITATDADNDTLTYTLSGTDAADFAIVSTTGQLKTSAALDFETDSSYAVTVTVSDGSLTDTITVTISITDVDETQPNNPPEFTEGDIAYRTVPQTSPDGDNIGAPISATDADGDTLTYTTTSTRFAIDSTSGQLLKKDGIEYVIDIEGKDYSTVITVTVSDGRGGSDSIQVFITLTYVYRLGCWRSTEVKAAIVAAAGVESWDEVTEAHLTAITSLDLSNLSNSFYDIYKGFANQFCGLTSLTHLDLSNNNIDGYFGIEEGTFEGEGLSSLTHLDLSYNKINKIDDNAFKGLSSLTHLDLSSNRKYNSYNSVELSEDSFAGLSSLTHLYLSRCGISSLPSDVFDGLSALTELSLSSNSLTSLPSDVFDGLSALTELSLSSNSITSLPSEVFDGLSALTELSLSSNSITSLPSEVFDGLSALTELSLSSNSITSLSSDVFDGLSALTELILHSNSITSLPSDVFDGLSALTRLYLHSNSITSLPSDVFDGLSALTELSLSSNSITSLPSEVFDGLSALTKLYLNNNQLNELPDGIFEGVSSLSVLWLQNNAVDPLPINVSLEKVGTNQVKAKAPTGAPSYIVLPITVTNGTISGVSISDSGKTTITIPSGSTESQPLTVIRTAGTTAAVTVNIGDFIPGLPPPLPSDHNGYAPVKPTTGLPLEVIAAVNGAPQSTKDTIPAATALFANYPNPSNPETWIPYQLAKPADVSLAIYNVRGVVVRQLTLGHQPAGVYYSRSRAAYWDGKNESGESVASGVYFYRLTAGEFSATRKMLIKK